MKKTGFIKRIAAALSAAAVAVGCIPFGVYAEDVTETQAEVKNVRAAGLMEYDPRPVGGVKIKGIEMPEGTEPPSFPIYRNLAASNGAGETVTEKAGTRYCYNYLGELENGAAYQDVYDQIAELGERVWNCTEDLELDSVYDDTFGTSKQECLHWALDTHGLSGHELVCIYFMVKADNPIYYFFSNTYYYSGSDILLGSDYAKASVRARCQQEILDYIDSFSDAASLDSTFAFAKETQKRLALGIEYAYDENGYPVDDLWAHSIIGPIESNSGVCEAYTRTFQMIMNYYGCDCLYVCGTGGTGRDADHAWNALKMDDGKYYFLDVTWDDKDNYDTVGYKYFMQGSEFFEETDHRPYDFDMFEMYLTNVPVTDVSEESYLVSNKDFYETVPAEAFGYDTLPDGTLEITGVKDDESLLATVIPETIEGRTVTGIGKDAFANSDIMRVKLPETLTDIGSEAFSGCTNLTEVNIPDGVEKLGDYAFDYCTSLTDVTLGSGVKEIGEGAFLNCKALPSITLPDGAETICYMAFADCTELARINIPDSVTGIAEKAFSGTALIIDQESPEKYADSWLITGDKSITELIVKEGTRGIASHAFQGFTALTKVVIPENSVNMISDYAFYGCTALETVEAEGALEYIGESAFANCKNLMSVTAAEGIGTADDHAFYKDSSLTTVSPLNAFGEYTFYGCSSLKQLGLNGDIPEYMFNGLTSLEELTLGPDTTSIGDYAFMGTSIKKLVIHSGIRSIGEFSFYNCPQLSELVLEEGVENIGEYAFFDCPSLKKVTVPKSAVNIGRCAFGVYISGGVAYEVEDFEISVYEGSAGESFVTDYWGDGNGWTFSSYNVIPDSAPETIKVTLVGEASGETEITAVDEAGNTVLLPLSEKGTFSAADLENGKYSITFRSKGFVPLTVEAEKTDTGVIIPKIMLYKYGDADGDGNTNMIDYALMQRRLGNWEIEIIESACDFTGDGALNMQDYALMQRMLAGWEIDYPAV